MKALRRHWLKLLAILVMSPSRAHAADAAEPRHYLGAALGVSTVMATKFDYGESYPAAVGLRAMYLYRRVNHVDLGGSLDAWAISDIGPVFTSTLWVRPFISLSSDVGAPEIGFSLHAGASLGLYHDTTWLGPASSLGPDFRIGVGRGTSVQVSFEAADVGGQYAGPPNSELEYQRVPRVSLGGWLGLIFAP